MPKRHWLPVVIVLIALVGFIGWQVAKDRAEAERLKAHDITFLQDGPIAPNWLRRFVGDSWATHFSSRGVTTVLGPNATDESASIAREYGARSIDLMQTTKLTDAGFAELAKIPGDLGLRLHKTGVTDDTFSAIGPLKNLRYLVIEEPGLTDAGLVHLMQLHSIKHIRFHATPITQNGIAELRKALPNCRVQSDLPPITRTISGAIFTDDAIAFNFRNEKLSELIDLTIRNAPITDAGLEHLKKLTRLRTLVLSGTKVTPTGVSNLRKALPHCKIEYHR